MKKTVTVLCDLRYCILIIIILFPFQLTSQNILNRPESVVYDSLYNRYLVSNWADGSIDGASGEDAWNLTSGIYLYQLKTVSYTKTKKMILLKW